MAAAAKAAALDVEAGVGLLSGTSNLDASNVQGSTWGWLRSPGVLCSTCSLCTKITAELYRRIKLEVVVELPMLRQRWIMILFGIIMQYVHGIFTQLAHRMHRPQAEPLHDVGFELTPELGPEHFWVSEAIFGTLFGLFVVWTFTPFVLQRKRFYTAVMWSRLLMVLVACQFLRCITFTVTQLPGPSFHCRAGQPTAIRPWPEHWSGHLVVDVQRQMSKSCGDLIFSSHTTFLLTGILAYTEYGQWLAMKVVAWLCGAIVCLLIIASRKHYTVDVVVAWYTVPLVFYTLHRRTTTRRPVVSEFLGAIGENDEPDPIASDAPNSGGNGGAPDAAAGSAGVDIKALLLQHATHAKERSVSTLKLGAGLINGGGADTHTGGLDQPAAAHLLSMPASAHGLGLR